MKVCIRADASNLIGSGHVMRCLTLAELFHAQGDEVSFICRDFPSSLHKLIVARGYRCYQLPYSEEEKQDYQNQESNADYTKWLGVDQAVDAKQTIDFIKNENIDLLVTDHYSLDISWESQLKPHVKHLMVIDDLANRKHACDVLLDYSYCENLLYRYDDLVPEHCQKLLGPKHALVNPKLKRVRDIRERKRVSSSIQRLLIFMGGIDRGNTTTEILRALLKSEFRNFEVDVVVGSLNPFKETISQLCKEHPNFEYHLQPEYYYDLLAKADFAIGAGGVAQIERCYVQLKTILLVVADNQQGQADWLHNGGHAYCLKNIGDICTLDFSDLDAITDLEVEPLDVSKLKLVEKLTTLSIREAEPTDARFVFETRNNPEISKRSFNKAKIEYSSHVQWFEKMLVDDARRMYILVLLDRPVGVIRFDFTSNGLAAEIGIYLLPEYQGKGFAAEGLALAEKAIKKESVTLNTIIAKVICDNNKSLDFFKRHGYSGCYVQLEKEI